MSDNGAELRRIVWSEAFPFVRLFRSLHLALGPKRLFFGLLCFVASYAGGRFLDALWSGRGPLVMPAGTQLQTEIEAYAQMGQQEFYTWKAQTKELRERLGVSLLIETKKAGNSDDAVAKLAEDSLRTLVVDKTYGDELEKLRKLVDERLQAGLAATKDDDQQRQNLIQAADTLRVILAEKPRGAVRRPNEVEPAIVLVTGVDAAQQNEDRTRLRTAVNRQIQLQQYDQLEPGGIYIGLLGFEMRCFAAAIQGVCAGRWGFAGGALDPAPSLAGSLVSAVRGAGWVVLHRPLLALLCGLWHLVVFALFGGALCRSAAVQAARDESIGLGDALRFAREKFGGFVLGPLLPAVMFAVVVLLLALGGLVGAIGYIGEWFTGVFYGLALLGGLALALMLLGTLLGFHLMWPTVAVEGSDGLDALSRAGNYVGSRIWHVGFYNTVLLLFGGAAFVLVRLVAMLTLKLSHSATKIGMNTVSSAELSGNGKLDALWRMPAWADLSLLPSAGDLPFWGTFHNVPLDWSEGIAVFFLRCWIYLVVGLVGGFVISFFFCGSTQMYYLLRRDVDATDWEEVYYEEPEQPFGAGLAMPDAAMPATPGPETPPPSGPETPNEQPPAT